MQEARYARTCGVTRRDGKTCSEVATVPIDGRLYCVPHGYPLWKKRRAAEEQELEDQPLESEANPERPVETMPEEPKETKVDRKEYCTTEAYYGVHNAVQQEKLTQTQWQTYEILWHYGPLSPKDINDTAQGVHGRVTKPMWGAQTKKLKLMGLVQEVDKNKFDVTGATEPTTPEVVKKPAKKKFQKGVEDLEIALISAEHLGRNSTEANDVLNWLKSKV